MKHKSNVIFYLLDPWSEGPMKYPPYICPFFCLSFCLEFFSRTTYKNFLIFCFKLRCHLTQKVVEPDFWKTYCSVFLGAKMPKVRLFKFYERSVCGICLSFWMKLQQNKSLKLTQIIFCGEILHWGFWTKIGPKLVFGIFQQFDILSFSDFLA